MAGPPRRRRSAAGSGVSTSRNPWLVQELAQGLDGGRAATEYLPDVGVDGQVGVALAGAQFGIFQCRHAGPRVPSGSVSSLAAGSGLTALASSLKSCTWSVTSPVLVRIMTPEACTKSPISNMRLKKSTRSRAPLRLARRKSCTLPAPSSMWAKESLPIGRVARMRPASVTRSSAPDFSASSKAGDRLDAGVGTPGAGGIRLTPSRPKLLDLLEADLLQGCVVSHRPRPSCPTPTLLGPPTLPGTARSGSRLCVRAHAPQRKRPRVLPSSRREGARSQSDVSAQPRRPYFTLMIFTLYMPLGRLHGDRLRRPRDSGWPCRWATRSRSCPRADWPRRRRRSCTSPPRSPAPGW